jgi:hypothetical protein
MAILIPIGAVVTLLGLGGLIWCILRVARARKSGLDDEALRSVMQKTVALNLGALFFSVIGLMIVVVGLLLGGA